METAIILQTDEWNKLKNEIAEIKTFVKDEIERRREQDRKASEAKERRHSNKEYLRRMEAIEYTGLKPSTFERRVKELGLKRHRIGTGVTRYYRADLDKISIYETPRT